MNKRIKNKCKVGNNWKIKGQNGEQWANECGIGKVCIDKDGNVMHVNCMGLCIHCCPANCSIKKDKTNNSVDGG